MSISEGQRRLVHARLEESIGGDAADLLMQMLPYQSHDELVTRSDHAATTTMLRGEMAELRAELRGEMVELRGEMAELRADVRSEVAGLQRWMAGVVAANAVAVVAALLA